MAGQRGERQIGARSPFDGTWTGQTTTGGAIQFTVRFGALSSFQFTTTVRQQCTRDHLRLQSTEIDESGAFALGLPGMGILVTGNFDAPGDMTGVHVDIGTSPACPLDTQGPVPGGDFEASKSGM
jgi:hypothetical protein